MDGYHFKCRSNIYFSEPSGVVLLMMLLGIDIVIVKRKFFEWDKAVYAWKRRILRLIIKSFLPGNFLVATPIGLMRKCSK